MQSLITMLVCGLVLIAIGASPARAASECTKVSANVLGRIDGWLAEDSSQTVLVTLTSDLNVDATAVFMPPAPADLASTGLRPTNLSLPDPVALPAGGTRLVKLGLTGIEEPGTYAVDVRVEVIDANRTACDSSVHIDASIAGRPAPTVAGGTDKFQAVLQNNSPWGTDWLARLLLQDGALREDIRVFLDNPSRGAADEDATKLTGLVRIRGEFRDSAVDPSEVYATAFLSTRYGTVSGAHLHVAREQLNADHYTGFAYFVLPNSTKRLVIPVDLFVRDGPILPILVLLTALLLGIYVRSRLKKWLPLSAIYAEWLAVRNDAKSVPEGDGRAKVFRLLGDAKSDIESGKGDHATRLLRRARAWIRIHRLGVRIAALDGHQSYGELVKHLRDVQGTLDDPDLDLDKLEKALATLEDAVTEAEATPPVVEEEVEVRVGETGPPIPPGGAEAEPSDVSLPRRLILRFTPGGVFYLLLVFLLAIGVKTLYVDAPTFGANPLIDYATIVGWGLGANAVSGLATKLVGDKLVSVLSI
jgi:hypothetical protein